MIVTVELLIPKLMPIEVGGTSRTSIEVGGKTVFGGGETMVLL